jgi:large subunit ribosomal protein L24
MRIKKGDTILIVSGKDRGKKTKVLEVFPGEKRLVAEGVNLRKKHVRARKAGEKGQVVQIASPIDASNVKLICSKCGKATRTGFKVVNKNKVRICKKCGEET